MNINQMYDLIEEVANQQQKEVIYEPVSIQCVSSERIGETSYLYETPDEIEKSSSMLGLSIKDYLISIM